MKFMFSTVYRVIQNFSPVHNVLKDVVYRRKVRDLADLRQLINEAVELITPHMLINTWQELEYLFFRICLPRCVCKTDKQERSSL